IETELHLAGNDLLVKQMTAGLAVRDLQAGAIGRASPSGFLPFLEDRLDADFQISPGEILLTRDLLEVLQTDPISSELLDGLDLRLKLCSSLVPDAAQPRLMPGVFQSSMGVEVNLLNDLLNDLVGAILRMSPQPDALRYQRLEFQLGVRDGLLRGDLPLLRLQGLRRTAEDPPEISTELTVHWGGPAGQVLEDGYTLRDLLRYLQRILPLNDE
ncbi:MAG: hypothetical protein V3T83_14850, partial [Acidobacteriota bacterium]